MGEDHAMIGGVLGLVLVSGTPDAIAVQLESTEGVEPQRVALVLESLSAALRAQTGRPPVRDVFASCHDSSCAPQLMARAGADEAWFVSAIGGATLIRIVVRRIHPEGEDQLHVDFPLDDSSWGVRFEGIVRTLTGAKPTLTNPTEDGTSLVRPIPETPTTVWPAWAAIGAGVLCAVIATPLRLSANTAATEAEKYPLSDPLRDPFASRAGSHGLGSNLLFGSAVGLITGGVVYLLTR